MKIIALEIDPTDDFSGVEAVALVNQPAIEQGFYAFNKEKQSIEDLIIEEIIKFELHPPCPAATQDLELNTKNRGKAIQADYIKYGPLNVDEPGDYWDKIADYWDTSVQAAKQSLCGNCVAFDISPRMKECMPGQTSDDEGELGYCWMHHFKCHSARACYTWAKGGPIVEDEISYDWQENSQTVTDDDYRKHKKNKRKRRYESVSIDGKLAYDTIEQALQAAEEMGCEGYHEHVYEESTYYMPCYDHDDTTLQYFESYTDYPESATNAARRALDYKEANPENSCGTRVGWTRANQLANREPISEETIARMASFKRHQQHKDVPYSEGCGGLMWDCWGGTAGIEWASNKLESIREEQSKDLFSYFDNLPIGRQNDILDHLKTVGSTTSQLREQGYEIVSNSNTEKKLGFGVRKTDAKPNKPTSDVSGPYKILFRYSGPQDTKNRKFCARLMELDLLFRKEDIESLTVRGANDEFGIYDIFRYKGSYNCRHFWNRVLIFQPPEPIPQTFYKDTFAQIPDQKMVVGPLMIPNKLILRLDDNNDPYYVYFTESTIKSIAQKVMKDNVMHSLNLEHDPDSPVRGYMTETWLVEDAENDKSRSYGFNLPVGTWIGSYKIEDDVIWSMVKDGIVNGFSVEGFFADKLIRQ